MKDKSFLKTHSLLREVVIMEDIYRWLKVEGTSFWKQLALADGLLSASSRSTKVYDIYQTTRITFTSLAHTINYFNHTTMP